MTLRKTIQEAAERTAGLKLSRTESVPIVETFRGQVVWEGVVEVFSIGGHTEPLVYAWAVESDQGPQYVTVLHEPPADSPIGAVRVWLVSQSKK